MLTVAILGPVEVHRDGERVTVPAGKTTELLARLALVAGTTVRTERLLEDLWAEDAVGTGRNTLQSKVSQLRRALGDPQLVIGSTDGYSLAVEASAIDALEVARLADEAVAFRIADDASNTARACAAALALFRGEGLYDASDAEWLAPHRAQLDGLRLRLVEERLAALMELGATGEVIGELEELV
ncbi:MAG: hypothetical protein QOG65_3454, partial [Actinomycetota bacterium]|nr:hypothetical protein [Actinomycetota bacterium]